MQRQSSHAGRGVEGLSHRDENRAGRLEPFDELRKVGEGTGQPVDLVDHDLLDETGIDVGEQALQARALQGSSREPRVLVDGWQQHPALRFLARDIRGAGFSLRIEGVELLFETLFRTLSRIDGTADLLHVRPCAWASDRKSVVLTSGCR